MIVRAWPRAHAAHIDEVGVGAVVGARSLTGTLLWGLTLTCRGSYAFSRVSTAQRMRAFLLAIATQAFCHPLR